MKNINKIYLDNNSTTPLDPEVFDFMKPYFLEKFGNASSKIHSFGFEAKSVVELSRRKIAELIEAESDKEIIFTSGATESINLAIKGIAEANYNKGNHIITSAIEHPAVLDCCDYLTKKGFNITTLGVDKYGFINIEELLENINDKTILISIQTANNEIGTIQNISHISEIANKLNIIFHTDATQAIGKIPFSVNKLNIDLVSFSAHKIYGPKGIGALYINQKKKIKLSPQIHGGGHEFGFRSGTLNVPAIAGFGKTAEICKRDFENNFNHYKFLSEKLLHIFKTKLNLFHLNGPIIENNFTQKRIPNNLNIRINGIKSENLLLQLKNIALSTGSACSNELQKESHVLKAIGLNKEEINSSFRIGIGKFNTEEEIEIIRNEIVNKINFLLNKKTVNNYA